MVENLPSTRHKKMLFLLVVSDNSAHAPSGSELALFYAEESEAAKKGRNLSGIE